MIVIPAIDLKDGRCARLTRGVASEAVFYSDDPAAVAAALESSGAPRIHLVDLDAAFGDASKNAAAVRAVRKAVKVPIQTGGGIRTAAAAGRLVAAGFDYVIMGTALLTAPAEVRRAVADNPGKVMAACDASALGRIAVDGWRRLTESSVGEYLKIASELGISEAVVTDISRDGTLEGVNVELYERLAEGSPVNIIVSGGVSSLDDIRKTAKMKSRAFSGIIVGKALYEHRFTLEEAIECSRSE